jgi:hypothetical protein
MIAFSFTFREHPTTQEGPARISVVAQSDSDAWEAISEQLSVPVAELRKLTPTIQMQEIRPGEIVVTKPGGLAEVGDPWPQIVSGGIRDITSVIRETVVGSRKDQADISLKRLGIDRLIVGIFSLAFLGSLGFAFYLISIDKSGPVFNFLFPIITAMIGLISGYLGGRSSSDSAGGA